MPPPRGAAPRPDGGPGSAGASWALVAAAAAGVRAVFIIFSKGRFQKPMAGWCGVSLSIHIPTPQMYLTHTTTTHPQIFLSININTSRAPPPRRPPDDSAARRRLIPRLGGGLRGAPRRALPPAAGQDGAGAAGGWMLMCVLFCGTTRIHTRTHARTR